MTLSILSAFYFEAAGTHHGDFLFNLPIATCDPHYPVSASSHLVCSLWPAFICRLLSHLLQSLPWGCVCLCLFLSRSHYKADCPNCVLLGLNRWWDLLRLWHLREEEIIRFTDPSIICMEETRCYPTGKLLSDESKCYPSTVAVREANSLTTMVVYH